MKSLLKKIVVTVLTLEARWVLRKYQPKIIAITGSVGKTTTKDYIYAVLDGSFEVRKTQKSMNSDIGIPLTILGEANAWYSLSGWLKILYQGALLLVKETNYPKLLVLEIGADHPGDISSACRWIKPDVSVLTRFPDVPVHVEFFSGPEEVIAEKRNLVRALKDDGVLVVNHDDPKTRSEITREQQTKFTFGLEKGADILADALEYEYGARGEVVGIRFRVTAFGRTIPMRLPGILGRAQVYSALGGIAVGHALGVNFVEVAGRLGNKELTPGRMRILPGTNHSTVIDDSYNSSPVALEQALETFANLEARGRKIAVLGDMLELGAYTDEAHQRAGEQVARVADVLVTVGIRSRSTAEAARTGGLSAGSVIECADSSQAAEIVKNLVTEGDVVLVKGSESIRCEKIVQAILKNPDEASKLLARQDNNWLAKK